MPSSHCSMFYSCCHFGLHFLFNVDLEGQESHFAVRKSLGEPAGVESRVRDPVKFLRNFTSFW